MKGEDKQRVDAGINGGRWSTVVTPKSSSYKKLFPWLFILYSSNTPRKVPLSTPGESIICNDAAFIFTGSQSSNIICSSLQCTSVDAACCVSKDRHPGGVRRANVNMHIAAALLRLQHDMADVLHRLHTLEELTKSQVKLLVSIFLSMRQKPFD